MMMDVRHPLKPYDRQMLEWAKHIQLPVHVLLTKADKLKRGPANASLLKVRKELAEMGAEFSVQLFSSLKRQGIAEARQVLNRWFEFENGRSE